MRFDAVNSAAVAIKSLTMCIMAFGTLASRYSEISAESEELSDLAIGIEQTLRERFIPVVAGTNENLGTLDSGSSPE
jgi:hypothetical protein